MQHFYKQYSSVPYVDTIEIDDRKENVFSYPLVRRNDVNSQLDSKNRVYGELDPELDSIELDLSDTICLEQKKKTINKVLKK